MTSAMNKIVHIGFGAFHRAHQLVYAQSLKNQGKLPWSYSVVSLFSDRDIRVLKEQGCAYHVLEYADDHCQCIDIDVVQHAYHPVVDGLDLVLSVLSDPDVTIVSLTITEKGYCMTQGFSQLNIADVNIQHDIHNVDSPKTAIGFLVAALQRRWRVSLNEKKVNSLTIMSCDNIPHNGSIIKKAILQFVQNLPIEEGAEFTEFILQNVSFPSTMVDRIVPAMTSSSRELLENTIQQKDACGIVCEPFSQWVIEDCFRAGRPEWELAGAELVEDVAPYETMKLRLLNGAHSWLAYVGYLLGYETVAEAISDKALSTAVQNLMLKEQAPTLTMPGTVDVGEYCHRLIGRFSNSQLHHRTWQIAMDGSQKIPQRWLQSLAQRCARGEASPVIELGLAAWLQYVSSIDLKGNPIDVRDPLADQFNSLSLRYETPREFADVVFDKCGSFPVHLRKDKKLKSRVLHAFDLIHEQGLMQTVCDTNIHYDA